jgi:Mg2+/Co2+ transporter CorC
MARPGSSARFATLLIRIGNSVTPGRGFREGPFATQVELRELVDLAEQRGVVEHGERDMIHSVFALGDTIAREVMVPRTDMVWIEANTLASQALTLALRSGFSRLPVIGETSTTCSASSTSRTGPARPRTRHRHRRCARLMRPHLRARVQAVDELLREMQAAGPTLRSSSTSTAARPAW